VLDELEELEQADGATGTPTDVEGASRKLIDAARAKDSRRETEGAGVVENVPIRAAPGAAVGAAKLEGAVFADTEGLNRRIAGTPRSP
jgi:hypothetical protein